MSKVYMVDKRHLRLIGIAVLLVILAYSYWLWSDSESAAGTAVEPRVIHMVTGEFRTTGAGGKAVEVYRWDPGTIVVREGELIELKILGMNGDHHQFVIEGLDVRGEVVKGKETVVSFQARKEGIYRIVCLNHHDAAHEGPMVGYIVVTD